MSGVPPAQLFVPQAPQNYGYQGVVEVQPMQKAAEDGVATLLIRHLPEAVPNDTLHRLFSYYGASAVRSCTSGRYCRRFILLFSSVVLVTLFLTWYLFCYV